jgi:hypothetical protein
MIQCSATTAALLQRAAGAGTLQVQERGTIAVKGKVRLRQGGHARCPAAPLCLQCTFR